MTAGNLPLSYLNADFSNIPAGWSDDFSKEVEAENFMLGGKSLYLNGPEAENAARHWIACLLLANFKCYRITPFEAIRRADGKSVYGDSEKRQQMLAEAECVLIDDFFDPDTKAFTDEMNYLFGWFLIELLRSGVTVIIASNNPKPELDTYTDRVWNIIQESFEVIRHGEKASTQKDNLKASPKKRQGIR